MYWKQIPSDHLMKVYICYHFLLCSWIFICRFSCILYRTPLIFPIPTIPNVQSHFFRQVSMCYFHCLPFLLCRFIFVHPSIMNSILDLNRYKPWISTNFKTSVRTKLITLYIMFNQSSVLTWKQILKLSWTRHSTCRNLINMDVLMNGTKMQTMFCDHISTFFFQ